MSLMLNIILVFMYTLLPGNQNNAILNAYLSTPNMKLSSVEMENIKNITSAIKNSPLQVSMYQ